MIGMGRTPVAAIFVNAVTALVSLKLAPEIFASVIGALAPVLVDGSVTSETGTDRTKRSMTRERPGRTKRGKDTGKGSAWRKAAALKGAETRRRQKRGAAAVSGQALKPRPRSKDARLQPVIALLREKAAEATSHSMVELERICRQRGLDHELLDEAVHHLGGHLSRNGGNALHAQLPNP